MKRRLAIGLVALGALVGGEAAASAGPLLGSRDGGELKVTNNLVFTRPDGSIVSFPLNVGVWCGRWAPDVPIRALHVAIQPPSLMESFWWLSAVVSDVKQRPTVRFPNTFVSNKPRGAEMFAVDGENELSSAEEEARGRIVFERARCGHRLRIRFRIRAKLGSEFFGGRRLSVRGTFRASNGG